MALGIGIVGIGFMGTTHFRALSKIPEAKVVAIATRDRSKWSGDWSSIKGNFGDTGGVQDLSDIAKYDTLDELLADPNVDLVDICLPTNLHRDAVLAAFQAGKHVLVEKPIALSLKDAQDMIAASDEAGKKLFVGQILRFMPEYCFLEQLIRSQAYGDPVGLTMKRVIGKPAWDETAWLEDEAQSGGPIFDLLIHDADFVNYLLGMPDRVLATGHITPGGHIPYYTAQLVYEKANLTVSVCGGTVGMAGRPFEQGYDLYLKGGYLQFNSTWRAPPQLICRDGHELLMDLANRDPFETQLRYVVDSLTGKETGERLDARSVLDSLRICLAVKEAIEMGQPQS